jgi:hypothetical protein
MAVKEAGRQEDSNIRLDQIDIQFQSRLPGLAGITLSVEQQELEPDVALDMMSNPIQVSEDGSVDITIVLDAGNGNYLVSEIPGSAVSGMLDYAASEFESSTSRHRFISQWLDITTDSIIQQHQSLRGDGREVEAFNFVIVPTRFRQLGAIPRRVVTRSEVNELLTSATRLSNNSRLPRSLRSELRSLGIRVRQIAGARGELTPSQSEELMGGNSPLSRLEELVRAGGSGNTVAELYSDLEQLVRSEIRPIVSDSDDASDFVRRIRREWRNPDILSREGLRSLIDEGRQIVASVEAAEEEAEEQWEELNEQLSEARSIAEGYLSELRELRDETGVPGDRAREAASLIEELGRASRSIRRSPSNEQLAERREQLRTLNQRASRLIVAMESDIRAHEERQEAEFEQLRSDAQGHLDDVEGLLEQGEVTRPNQRRARTFIRNLNQAIRQENAGRLRDLNSSAEDLISAMRQDIQQAAEEPAEPEARSEPPAQEPSATQRPTARPEPTVEVAQEPVVTQSPSNAATLPAEEEMQDYIERLSDRNFHSRARTAASEWDREELLRVYSACRSYLRTQDTPARYNSRAESITRRYPSSIRDRSLGTLRNNYVLPAMELVSEIQLDRAAAQRQGMPSGWSLQIQEGNGTEDMPYIVTIPTPSVASNIDENQPLLESSPFQAGEGRNAVHFQMRFMPVRVRRRDRSTIDANNLAGALAIELGHAAGRTVETDSVTNQLAEVLRRETGPTSAIGNYVENTDSLAGVAEERQEVEALPSELRPRAIRRENRYVVEVPVPVSDESEDGILHSSEAPFVIGGARGADRRINLTIRFRAHYMEGGANATQEQLRGAIASEVRSETGVRDISPSHFTRSIRNAMDESQDVASYLTIPGADSANRIELSLGERYEIPLSFTGGDTLEILGGPIYISLRVGRRPNYALLEARLRSTLERVAHQRGRAPRNRIVGRLIDQLVGDAIRTTRRSIESAGI